MCAPPPRNRRTHRPTRASRRWVPGLASTISTRAAARPADEFCPQQHVRQFRQEGNRVGVEFSLGSYEKSADKLTVGVRGALTTKDFLPHTLSQRYSNGTADRRTEVRVRCSHKNEHTLLSVEEPTVHAYTMVFSSPLGCELSCAYGVAAVAP